MRPRRVGCSPSSTIGNAANAEISRLPSLLFFLSSGHAGIVALDVPRYQRRLLIDTSPRPAAIMNPANRESNLEKPRQIRACRSPAAIRLPGSTWRCWIAQSGTIGPLVPNQGIYRASYNPGLIQGRKGTSVRQDTSTDGRTDGRTVGYITLRRRVERRRVEDREKGGRDRE